MKVRNMTAAYFMTSVSSSEVRSEAGSDEIDIMDNGERGEGGMMHIGCTSESEPEFKSVVAHESESDDMLWSA